MKTISLIIFTLLAINLLGQDKTILSKDSIKQITNIENLLEDSLLKKAKNISENYISLEKYDAPLFLYNGIVINSLEFSNLNLKLMSEITVIKYPESFSIFGYVGVNGLILLKGKQKIKFTTLKEIRSKEINLGNENFIYALNGYIISDSSFKISKKSVVEIEILNSGSEKGLNKKYKNYNCINVWTLNKAERKEIKFKPCGTWRKYAETLK